MSVNDLRLKKVNKDLRRLFLSYLFSALPQIKQIVLSLVRGIQPFWVRKKEPAVRFSPVFSALLLFLNTSSAYQCVVLSRNVAHMLSTKLHAVFHQGLTMSALTLGLRYFVDVSYSLKYGCLILKAISSIL